MPRVTTKKEEVKYLLELTKREANALTELLLTVNDEVGEGPLLNDVYFSLVQAGCEADTSTHAVHEDGTVTIYNDAKEDA